MQFRPEGPAESSTPEHAATIAPPCPNCPIWRSSRTPSTLRSPAGRIVRAEAPAPLAVRGTPAELAALVGQELRHVRRRGKFIILELDRDRVAVNAMLTGRFQLAAPERQAAGEHRGDPGLRRASDPAEEGRRLDEGRGVAPGRRPTAAELRYRDPSQMGKVYLLPAGVVRP